jgi:hypothetical protein
VSSAKRAVVEEEALVVRADLQEVQRVVLEASTLVTAVVGLANKDKLIV